MSAIISGYEYDIFISYRQKDNKYDGWVNEFVANLEKELDATFKEDISIYFDVNPHDGVLENHNVEASLKEKLNCLVFIPVISRTYCDPKSYAWQKEFLVFNELVRKDHLGKNIRLSNGNVASRILPVRIHELDAEDKTLLENELGGIVRSIDFVYRSDGVNRSLRPFDEPTENLYRSNYRNQINKVANAIKELISALENPVIKEKSKPMTSDATGGKKKPDERSIAVLPFTDLSPAHDQEYLGDGMAVELISILTHIGDLTVTGRTSSFSFKNKNLDLKTIGNILNVKTILEGSIQKSGNRVRITVQLINASNGNHLWSQRYDREFGDIFDLQDDICSKIVEHLKMTILEEYLPATEKRPVINPLAYEMYLKGDYYDQKYTRDGFEKAIVYFTKAVEIEPDYSDAWWYLGLATFEFNSFLQVPERIPDDKLEKVIYCANRSVSIDPSNPYPYFLKALVHFSCDYDWIKVNAELEKANDRIKTPFPLFFTPLEPWFRAMIYGDFDFAIRRMQQAVNFDPLNQFYQFHLAHILLYVIRDFRRSINVLNNLMELGHPENSLLSPLCLAYLFDKEYDLAEKYARKEFESSQGKGQGAAHLIICLAASGKKKAALKLYKEVCDRLTFFEFPELLHVKANAFLGNIDEAFEYLDKAISEKNYWLNTLKYSPEWDLLRPDPRFKNALIRMRFPE